MSKLNIDQQTIKELFSNKRSDFLIPDYQRPYAWEETECQTLWDDIFAFAFPENDYSLFKSDEDEYFLGPIVTFKNTDGKLEIIDGQHRAYKGEHQSESRCHRWPAAFDHANAPSKSFFCKVWRYAGCQFKEYK